MKFKVGDRVRFLNDQGGGIVTKVISSSLVNVRIEDGFEIPTVVSELIKESEQQGKSDNMLMGMPASVEEPTSGSGEVFGDDQVSFDDRISPLEVFRQKVKPKRAFTWLMFLMIKNGC